VPSRKSWRGIATGLLGGQCMRVVYSDESTGSDERANAITVVTAIVLNMDSQWPSVSKDIRAIGYKGEFKGKQLFRDLSKNTKEKMNSARYLTQLLSIPSDRGLFIFYGAVDDKGLARYRKDVKRVRQPTARELAMAVCLKRVDSFMLAVCPKENAIWIADRCETNQTLTEMMFSDVTHLQERNVSDVYGGEERHELKIVDAIYEGNSARSRALQLADVCCSTIASIS
jgi:hypothetical protein